MTNKLFDNEQIYRIPITDHVIVLDIDETLVHADEQISNLDNLNKNIPFMEKLKFKVIHLNDNKVKFPIWYITRPYLREFLLFCFSYFRFVCVWSAGDHRYVNEIVQSLFKFLPKPHIVFTKNNCYHDTVDNYNKPLNKIIDELNNKYKLKDDKVTLKNILILDDRLDNFIPNPKNGILVPTFSPRLTIKDIYREIENDDNLLLFMEWLQKDNVITSKNVKLLNKKTIF